MTEPRVIFDSVWKKFRRGERHDSLRDLIPAAARRLLGRQQSADLQEHEFWVLADVSFAVQPGTALGIIGSNGAGKSTSLKLLTRILKPTKGQCLLRGRVGALIEVAAGFHGDLTGRENVFLQGAIMGMRQQETRPKFDEMVEFSGIEPFIDTPVKRYSSGMNARLGFSIAAHLNPAENRRRGRKSSETSGIRLDDLALTHRERLQPGDKVLVHMTGQTSADWTSSRHLLGLKALSTETGATVFVTGSDRLPMNLPVGQAFAVTVQLTLNLNGGNYLLQSFVWDAWEHGEACAGPSRIVVVERVDSMSGHSFRDPVVIEPAPSDDRVAYAGFASARRN